MRKFLKLAALAAIAVAFVGCGNDKPGPDSGSNTPSYTQDLKFTLTLEEVEADQAKIVVEHNGTTQDTWYGFATTETDIVKAIADVLAKGNLNLQNRTKYTARAKNLEPDTDYTYITFGVTADGKTYGEPAYIEFTTKKAEETVGFTENPNWTLAYTGEKEFKGETYKHTVTVTSKDQNKWFLSSGWTKEDFEKAHVENGLEAILQYEFERLMYYVDYYKSQGYDVTVADFLYQGTDWDVVDITPGDWYVMAIGVNDNGELSGLYAISDVISIAEETATEDYLAWIGTWTLTDADGVSLTATFEKDINNVSYNMYGYDAANLGREFPVKVTWIPDYKVWTIYPQSFGTLEFEDEDTGDVFYGDLYFLGGQLKEDGTAGLYTDVPICIGGMDENGNRVVVGYSDEEKGINLNLMSHFIVIDNTPYLWGDINTIPMLPMTITEAPAETPTAMAKVKGIKANKMFTSKHSKAFVPSKTFTSNIPLKMY